MHTYIYIYIIHNIYIYIYIHYAHITCIASAMYAAPQIVRQGNIKGAQCEARSATEVHAEHDYTISYYVIVLA